METVAWGWQHGDGSMGTVAGDGNVGIVAWVWYCEDGSMGMAGGQQHGDGSMVEEIIEIVAWGW